MLFTFGFVDDVMISHNILMMHHVYSLFQYVAIECNKDNR